MGVGVAGGFIAVAARFPDRDGLVDELGSLTFREIDQRSNAVADELAELGVTPGDGVALLARNHRGFLDAVLGDRQARRRRAAAQHRLRRSPARRGVRARGRKLIIHDQEFDDLSRQPGSRCRRCSAWVDDDRTTATTSRR